MAAPGVGRDGWSVRSEAWGNRGSSPSLGLASLALTCMLVNGRGAEARREGRHPGWAGRARAQGRPQAGRWHGASSTVTRERELQNATGRVVSRHRK